MSPKKSTRPLFLLAALLLPPGCSNDSPQGPSGPPSPAGTPVRVLMITTTAGFRHDSIGTARNVMNSLSSTGGFTLTATEDLSTIAAGSLASYDVVFFALTTGELPLGADQKTALLDFVSRGGGFMGVHSATDTLYTWSEYGQLVGAYFKEHPWTTTASVVVEDQAHPTTMGLGASFTIREEFYTFRENPRPNVSVLLRLDAGSVGAAGDYPLAWVDTHGAGRVYYNALGHFEDTWRDPRFQQQMTAAVRWTGRK
jgi:type 1 glutamine amidotransferase